MYDPRENDNAAALEVVDKDKADEDCRDRSSSGGDPDPAPENNSEHYELEDDDSKCDVTAWIIRTIQLLAIIVLGIWVFSQVQRLDGQAPHSSSTLTEKQVKTMVQELTKKMKDDLTKKMKDDVKTLKENIASAPTAVAGDGLDEMKSKIEDLEYECRFGKQSLLFDEWKKALKTVARTHASISARYGTMPPSASWTYTFNCSCGIDYTNAQVNWNYKCTAGRRCGFCRLWTFTKNDIIIHEKVHSLKEKEPSLNYKWTAKLLGISEEEDPKFNAKQTIKYGGVYGWNVPERLVFPVSDGKTLKQKSMLEKQTQCRPNETEDDRLYSRSKIFVVDNRNYGFKKLYCGGAFPRAVGHKVTRNGKECDNSEKTPNVPSGTEGQITKIRDDNTIEVEFENDEFEIVTWYVSPDNYDKITWLTNGSCGPDNGDQCPECVRYQTSMELPNISQQHIIESWKKVIG